MNMLLLIFLLFLVLAILVILNHMEVVSANNNTDTNTRQIVSAYDNIQGTCADTHFGCCPDGINSKDNIFGSNCPTFEETQ